MAGSEYERTIADVGELELIALIEPYLVRTLSQNVIVGPGDDAAVVTCGSNNNAFAVLTCDMLVEGVHFPDRSSAPWRLIGRKAMTSNVSDVAAMAGNPRYALISLGLPRELHVGAVLELYTGMAEIAGEHGFSLVGGDTVASPVVIISIALLGERQACFRNALRSNCRPGQWLYVSGHLGASRAGLELLLDKNLSGQIPSSLAERLIQRQLNPTAHVALGQALAVRFADLAMIDISDSLWNELGILSKCSGVSIEVWADAIPIAKEVRKFCTTLGRDPLEYALFSGEEYELLFACTADDEEIHACIKDLAKPVSITKIGQIKEPPPAVRLIGEAGQSLEIRDKTFQHFLS